MIGKLRRTLSDLRVIAGLARQLVAISPNRHDAIRNAYTILRVWASDRGWMRLRTAAGLRIGYLGARFQLAVANRAEVEVVREMFVEKQYQLEGLDPNIVLDLGSNIGASIAFFHAQYPHARIIGLEPDPATFERLEASVSQLPGVEIYPWAVSDRSGRVPFRQAAQSWVSAISSPDMGSIEVEALSLHDLLTKLDLNHVDLLKLDVEGAEWRIFTDPRPLAACQTIIGELHLDQPDQTCERAVGALSHFDVTISGRVARRLIFVAHQLSAG